MAEVAVGDAPVGHNTGGFSQKGRDGHPQATA